MDNRIIRVLLVEGNPDDVRLVREFLRQSVSSRYEIDHADRLDTALQRLTDSWFHVLLVDFTLPDSTGFETFARLHAQAPHLPIVVLSGLADQDLAASAVGQGAQDYLNKAELDGNMLERTLRYAIERKRAEQDLRESEARYRSIFENSTIGLYRTSPDGRIVMANPTLIRMLGYATFEELAQQPMTDHYWAQAHSRQSFIERVEREGQIRDFESAWRRSDGSVLFIREGARVVRDASGQTVCYEGSVEDITQRKLAEEQLLYHAFHDALTGLYNRALLLDRLRQAIARAKEQRFSAFSVLFLDCDGFKLVNDSFGHVIGDRLLVAFARRLERCVRDVDTLVRLGGDEFVFLIDNPDSRSAATTIAQRVLHEADRPFIIDDHEVFMSASIGIVASTAGYERAEDILRDADIAMYRAKAAGRARYEIFEPHMRFSVAARLDIETDLHRALDRNEFRVYYQPIVCVKTGRVSGFEALVRWQHPTRGLFVPSDFVLVATETGMIVPLGRWVIREACNQLRAWQNMFPSEPPLIMSVNLAAKELAEQDLPQFIADVLTATRIRPSSLELEFTESALVDTSPRTEATLKQLDALDVQMTLDDFGTGYSSLAYLEQLPIDAIKIDRSFVCKIVPISSRSIVPAIITLAHDLGLRVVAEGVESMDQLARLAALHCEFGQGHLFSPPTDGKTMETKMNAMLHASVSERRGSRRATTRNEMAGSLRFAVAEAA